MMKRRFSKNARRWTIAGIFVMICVFSISISTKVNATGITMSPMRQKIVLNPGESYSTSVTIANPGTNNQDIEYEAEIGEFYVDDNNQVIFEANGDSAMMKDWIIFDSERTGKLSPNEHKEITLTINVPEDAPGGGQYVTIMVTAKDIEEDNQIAESDNFEENRSAMFNQVTKIGHLIYAEVTGKTIRQGEILSANVPSFLLSGNIIGSATIKNTGNVHGDANFVMQIYPLFSNEEVYTNEEEPEMHTILPGQTRYEEIVWDKTPDIGIFNAIYTVEFAGVTTQVSKMVIKCPIWLLFIIFFVIAAIVIWMVMRIRAHGKANKRKIATE